jgi:hypothetical protein
MDEFEGLDLGVELKPIKLGLMFFGGCGCNVALQIMKLFDPQEHPHLHVFITNTDGPQLRDFFLNPESKKEGKKGATLEEKNFQAWLKKAKSGTSQVQILLLGHTGKGAGGIPEVAAKAMQEERVQKKVNDFLCPDGNPLDALILVGGAGKGTGAGCLPEAAKMAIAMNVENITAIITMPLKMEAERRFKQAEVTKATMLGICPTIVIYNEQIPDKDVAMSVAWKNVNDACIVKLLDAMRSVIQTVGRQMDTDLADQTTGNRTGTVKIFASAKLEKEHSIEKFTEDVIKRDPYQDVTIWTKVQWINALFRGPWIMSEEGAVLSALKDGIEPSLKEKLIVNLGVAEEDGTEKWVALEGLAVMDSDESAAEGKQKLSQPAGEYTSTLYVETSAMGKTKEIKVSADVADRWNRFSKNGSGIVDEVALGQLFDEIEFQTGVRPFVKHYGFARAVNGR